MSYSIIFQTKIIKLNDGRIIHLSRQGCNNDTAGREKGVYDGKLYTEKEFNDFIKKFDVNDNSEWSLKIGSKYSTWKDYAEHLKRMYKRATTWGELSKLASEKFKQKPYVRYLVSVDVKDSKDGVTKTFTADEWEKVSYDYMLGYHTYHFDFAYDIDEIVSMLEQNKYLEFHVV